MVIKIVTIQQMREIEAAVDANLMSYDAMMQNAGKAAANHAALMVSHLEDPQITLLIGAGNNGGDGLVAAKHLTDLPNANIRLYLLKRRDDDPLFTAVQETGVFIAHAEDDHDNRLIRNMVASSDLVVDALFGIGLRLPLRDSAAVLLRNVNQAINIRKATTATDVTISPTALRPTPKPHYPKVLALDCPSGLDCDTGEIDSNAIPADETITFIAAKPGLFAFPGAAKTGNISVTNIGIPDSFETLASMPDILIDATTVRERLPQRPLDGHKGTYGKTMIVAGSINYSGAAGLAAKAAYRAGTGVVTIATPPPIINTLSANLLETTWVPLPHDMGVIAERAVQPILDHVEGYSALLIGPGLGQEKTTGEFLYTLLNHSQNTPKRREKHIGFGAAPVDTTPAESAKESLKLPPLIIDADGLNLLAKLDNWWEKLPQNTIITPHPGEMARLCKLSTTEVQANRWQMARDTAQKWGTIVVLKGANTLIASPNGNIAVLPFKTDALSTAGTGDVLAGLIAGFAAQRMEPFDAAICGAYIHGLAGQLAAQKQGTGRSVMAGDVLTMIAETFSTIDQH